MTETRTPAEQAADRFKSLRTHIFVPLSEVIPAGQVGKYADEITRLVKPELEGLYIALLEAQADREKFELGRNAVYRERAHLVALLAALFPSHIGYTDPDEPDWTVVIIETPAGQLSWHVARDDMDLFAHVSVSLSTDRGWDGHSTEEKYERVRKLAANVSAAPRPPYSPVARCPQRRGTSRRISSIFPFDAS